MLHSSRIRIFLAVWLIAQPLMAGIGYCCCASVSQQESFRQDSCISCCLSGAEIDLLGTGGIECSSSDTMHQDCCDSAESCCCLPPLFFQWNAVIPDVLREDSAGTEIRTAFLSDLFHFEKSTSNFSQSRLGMQCPRPQVSMQVLLCVWRN